MAPRTEEQFAEKLAEVQGLLDQLERLICHQSGDLVENFEDLLYPKSGSNKKDKSTAAQSRWSSSGTREILGADKRPTRMKAM